MAVASHRNSNVGQRQPRHVAESSGRSGHRPNGSRNYSPESTATVNLVWAPLRLQLCESGDNFSGCVSTINLVDIQRAVYHCSKERRQSFIANIWHSIAFLLSSQISSHLWFHDVLDGKCSKRVQLPVKAKFGGVVANTWQHLPHLLLEV